MNKQVSTLFLIIGLISLSSAAYTTYYISGQNVQLPFDGFLGQVDYFSSNGTTFQRPSDLVYDARGGLYVANQPPSANQGGSVIYYANSYNNVPTYAVGAASPSESGSIPSPSGIAVYSSGSVDYVLAVASGGVSYSKFYNITGNTPGAGSDIVTNIVTSVGGTPSTISSGNYLSIVISQNNGALYFADSGNNRVVEQPNNASSLPLRVFGTGSNGLASSCNQATTTCFNNPTAVGVDCNNGVWVAVNGVNNATLSGVGILYFPAGSVQASALFIPNITSDFLPALYGISFNADCSKIAFAGSYRVYLGNLALNSNNNPLVPAILPPQITSILSLGASVSSGAVPAAGSTTNSLSIVQNVAFDPNNNNRLAIADTNHNRVVFVNYNSTAIGANVTAASPSISQSSIVVPTLNSTAPSASSSSAASASSSSALNSTSPSFSSTSINSPSNTPSASSTTYSSTPSGSSLSMTPSNTNTATYTYSASTTPYTYSNTNTNTATYTYTYTPSSTPYTYSSTPSESESGSPYPSYTPQYGAGMRMQSWVQLF